MAFWKNHLPHNPPKKDDRKWLFDEFPNRKVHILEISYPPPGYPNRLKYFLFKIKENPTHKYWSAANIYSNLLIKIKNYLEENGEEVPVYIKRGRAGLHEFLDPEEEQ